MAKNGKNSAFIDDPQRCAICGTTLTLYPKDFATCPHCQKAVCRQCWGSVWPSKSFTAEACAHLAESGGLAGASMTTRSQGLNWDWPKVGLATGLVLLAVGIIYFLLNLFA